MNSTTRPKYNIVDLFAGAGGLSYGFLQTGRYNIKAAFENDLDAQQSYRNNHCVSQIYDDVADALTDTVRKSLGTVDVVVGGPPCQGFSNANRQKNHVISQNNSLVKQFVHTILYLNPTAFVMENVSMFQSSIHRFYVDANDDDLIREYRIASAQTSILLLDAKHIFDGVESIVSEEKRTKHYLWDEKDYLLLNIIYKKRASPEKLRVALDKHERMLISLAERLAKYDEINDHILHTDYSSGKSIIKYFSGERTPGQAKILCDAIEAPIVHQRMLAKAQEIFDNRINVTAYTRAQDVGLVAMVKSVAVIDYIEAILGSPKSGYTIAKGVLSATDFGVPQKRMRFVAIGIKREKASKLSLPMGSFSGSTHRTVRDAIGDLECVETSHDIADGYKGVAIATASNICELGQQLRDSSILFNHVATATTPETLKKFRAIQQGGNFHTLSEELKSAYSDPTRTQNTIYLRLRYEEPSETVVNIRKSMWIHPVRHRALSIREAARLQTFPDSFVFYGTKDSQYQQIGNAVPPMMAKSIAEHLCEYLDNTSHDKKVNCDE